MDDWHRRLDAELLPVIFKLAREAKTHERFELSSYLGAAASRIMEDERGSPDMQRGFAQLTLTRN